MEKLLRAVYASEKKKKCLSVTGKICVYTNIVFFALVLALLVLGPNPRSSLIAAASAALGYAVVTVSRKLFNYPRPYEVYDFYIVKPRGKAGGVLPQPTLLLGICHYHSFLACKSRCFSGTFTACGADCRYTGAAWHTFCA